MGRRARTIHRIGLVVAAGFLGALVVAAQPAPAQPAPPDPELADLEAATGGDLRVERHAETGAVRFLGTEAGRPLDLDAAQLIDGAAELFGVAGDSTLSEAASVDRPDGGAAVRYQQEVDGIPVLAGEVVVRAEEDGRVLSATGEASPSGSIDTTAELPAGEAAALAVEATARAHGDADGLSASAPELWVFDPALLDGPESGPARLVWRTEVTDPGVSVRELVLVDADTGGIALQFDQIAHSRDRKVCNDDNTPDFDNSPSCTVFVRQEGEAPTGDPDVDLAYDYSGQTYDFFFDRFGRDSLDGSGMQLRSTVRWCPHPMSGECPYRNAFWNGSQMTYGEGFAAADDVVGHELTHGLTQFTSDLLYYYQSGAINESLSDIFGELVDLTNDAGTDTAPARWLLGEDVPGFGAIRDMEHPPGFNHPDRMKSALYTGTTFDNGGVHTNSGVSNKAAFLITDGGTFNGRTVAGLGIDKAASIYYEVESAMLTSGSDYADLGTALSQACTNLVGTGGITAADCTEVGKAVLATEMALSPTNAPAPEAPVCPAGQGPTDVFADGMEDPGAGTWVMDGSVEPNNWRFSSDYAHGGDSSLYVSEPGFAKDARVTNPVDRVLPAGARLWFAHAYDTQLTDGGVIEYSVDGGGTWTDAGSMITNNGYTTTISSGSNPLNNRPVFAGVSNGYRSTRLDLSSLAGQSVRFRFRFGTDNAGADLGWYVDDVRLYTCALNTCDGLTVTVNLATGGTPTAGNDVILGTAANNTINGLGGNDRICGLGGRDVVDGGPGSDRVFGAGGDDALKGAGGTDRLEGGLGNDGLNGGAGTDTLLGQAGADSLNGGPDRDSCNGGTQTDTASGCEVRSGIP